MGYQIVNPDTVDPLPDRSSVARPIAGASGDHLRFDQLGIRLYDAEPGEQLPLKYHYHEKQEEAFYVLSGILNIETPDETYTVSSGKVFLAEAGSPHRAYNASSSAEPVRVLAMGAPTGDSGHQYDP